MIFSLPRSCSHVRLTIGLLLTTLCLVESIPVWGQNGNVARFAEIAKQVANHEFSEKFDPKISEALDILIAETLKVYQSKPNATDAQVEAALKPFQKVANGSKEMETFSTSVTWFQVSTHHVGDRVAIGVNYGPYAKLRVHNLRTRQRERLPSELDWMFRWRPSPAFAPSGNLIVISESIQDAGVRVDVRTDYLTPDKAGYALKKSFTRSCTLDGGGAELKGDQLIIQSIDPPRSFFTAMSDTLFPRKEVLDCSGPTPHWLRDEKGEAAFRALDTWMFQAQRTQKPDHNQAHIKRIVPEYQMIEDYKVKKLDAQTTRIDLTFNGTTLRCLVKGSNGAYQVISVTTLKP